MKDNLTFLQVHEKIKQITGLSTLKEVAERIGVDYSSYRQRKRENSIPYAEIIEFCIRENWSLNKVFLGIGSPYLENPFSVDLE